MKDSTGIPSGKTRLGVATVLAVLGPLMSARTLWAQEKAKEPPPAKAAPAPLVVEVRLIDRSTMKVALREERIELVTRYGNLSIPVAEIRRIEFGLRLSDQERGRIAAAVEDLGHKDYRRRQAAATELQALREKAYPALLQVAKGKDAEAVRRAEQLLEKVREAVPAEDLELRPYDVVHTDDSTIAGQIRGAVLRVGTLAFGDQPLRLADVRELRTASTSPREVNTGVLPDPGTLGGFQGQVGKTFAFRVVGPNPAFGQGMGVFGTDVYTVDSSLAGAAVHAGVLRPGQAGVVRVTVVGQHPGFQASVRNGIASQGWGPWAGYRVERPGNAGGNR